MKKVVQEIVTVFYEGDTPVGILMLNGHANFFRTSKATKEFINNLLEVDKKEE